MVDDVGSQVTPADAAALEEARVAAPAPAAAPKPKIADDKATDTKATGRGVGLHR